MFDRFLTLGRQTLVYGFGGAALQLIGLLTIPIFTRVFDANQYGVLETTIAAYMALIVLADLGITSAAQRSYYDYDEVCDAERRATLTTGLGATMGLALAWAAVAFVFARPVAVWQFNGNAQYASMIRIAAVGIPVAVLCNFLREAVRLKVRPWAYTISLCGGALIGTGIALVLVLALHRGIGSLLWGMIAGNAFSSLVSLGVLRGAVLGRFSWPELRRMLAFGLPLIPTAIAAWGVAVLDRSLLTKLAPGSGAAKLAASGEYALANRFAGIVAFCTTAFVLAYEPFQLSLWREDPVAEKEVRARVLPYVAVVFVSAAVMLSLFAREIATVVSPHYATAYRAVGMLAMSLAVFGIGGVALAGIRLTRRMGYLAAYTGAALALNVALNMLLIPSWGMMGAAFATLAAYALLAGLIYHRAQILYPTPYPLRKTLTVIAAGQAATLVGLVRFDGLGLAVGAKLATLLAFALSLWVLGVLNRADLEGLRTLLRRSAGPAVPPIDVPADALASPPVTASAANAAHADSALAAAPG